MQSLQHAVGMAGVTHSQRHQAQARGPAFDLPLEGGEGVLARAVAQHRGQELGGLRPGEAQVLEPHFGDPVAGAQARQRQRRVAAGNEH